MGERVDHTGEVFEGLVITGRGPIIDGYQTWQGICRHCGKRVEITYRAYQLQKSCGCMKRRERSGYIYLAVTPDKYELPIAVADTAEELASIMGVAVHTVRQACTPSHMERTQKRKIHMKRTVCYYRRIKA